MSRPPMIPRDRTPTAVTGRVRPYGPDRRRVVIRLWLPVTPLVLLLAPVALVGAPLLALTRAGRRTGLWRRAWAIGGLLLSLSGTAISVDSPAAQVQLRIL